MTGKQQARLVNKVGDFLSGILFLFGVAASVGGEWGYAIFYFIAAVFCFGLDLEVNDKESD